MPAKTPMYLKPSTPKRGRQLKLRDMLSGDMISPPLGDLQHSAHVGPEGEGDMFGDVGFLRGKLDMLPSLACPPHSRSDAMGRRLDDVCDANSKGMHHGYSSHGNSCHTSFLKSTISMPAFLTPEAPPKPPRLHLGKNSSPRLEQQKQHSLVLTTERGAGYMEPCRDLSLSASSPMLTPLMASMGSFSEPSSDDSTSDCGPLEPGRGLSLDFDAGLSNEDLRSEFSESPALSPTLSPALSHGSACSVSLATLDLDLGPSILEDVLGIMDRYKSTAKRGECELAEGL